MKLIRSPALGARQHVADAKRQCVGSGSVPVCFDTIAVVIDRHHAVTIVRSSSLVKVVDRRFRN